MVPRLAPWYTVSGPGAGPTEVDVRYSVHHAVTEGELWEEGSGSCDAHGDGPSPVGWYWIVEGEEMADWFGPFDTEAEAHEDAQAYSVDYDASMEA